MHKFLGLNDDEELIHSSSKVIQPWERCEQDHRSISPRSLSSEHENQAHPLSGCNHLRHFRVSRMQQTNQRRDGDILKGTSGVQERRRNCHG